MNDSLLFSAGPVDLKTVRNLAERLANIAADDPALAVSYSNQLLPRLTLSCTRSEILGARGTALRRLGRIEDAQKDLAAAARACSCPACRPRISRRRAVFYAALGRDDEALAQADQSVEGFRRLGEEAWVGRALTVRGLVHWFSWWRCEHAAEESLENAISDSREAILLIPASDLHHFCATLQSLACYLSYQGDQESWAEALHRIKSAEYRLNKVSGGRFRTLKLHLRWIKCLAELQLGRGKNHRRKMEQIAK